MTATLLPRILSPNLGCPLILSPKDLHNPGADVVAATDGQKPDWRLCKVRAIPSRQSDGAEFLLKLEEVEELKDGSLPESFQDVSETRRLISATLRCEIFEGKARFWRLRVRTEQLLTDGNLRTASSPGLPTLYNLVLDWGAGNASEVKHALCVRRQSGKVRFIHLTDLHLAARNDLFAEEANRSVTAAPGSEKLDFLNFNDRFRAFIQKANELADKGELDFVLALGDLVDFVLHGFHEACPGDNNWQVFIDLVTGERDSEGLRVPIFTTTGNHDWRLFPYPPEVNPKIFNLEANDLEKFDYLYYDSPQVIADKISKVHAGLVSEGSRVLARTWWRSILSPSVLWLENLEERGEARILAWAKSSLRMPLLGGGGVLATYLARNRLWELIVQKWQAHPIWFSAIVLVLAVAAALLWRWFFNFLGDGLRNKITQLIGIEADVGGLRDYFLHVNPYFNYAFCLEHCYFLILDTGPDVLTAQTFWDDGAKKLRNVSVRDNMIGGSPETMAFYPANHYYPYSQIAWLEVVLKCIGDDPHHGQVAGTPRRCRVFVGLHAPAANLSKGDRGKVDKRSNRGVKPVLLPKGDFDVRYGTVNHYLSQFYYLCLGYRQAGPWAEPSGPGIDVVLAGHAHWSIEFKLVRPTGCREPWKPAVLYGDFSPSIEQDQEPNQWWGPLLLQTGACGPPSDTDPDTPNFRCIVVDADLAVRRLRPVTLRTV